MMGEIAVTGMSPTGSVDESLSWNGEVNMTNCYKLCEVFFKRYRSINLKVLIGFWMKAGYLGPVYSAERAYSKGHGILMELIQQGILKYSDEDSEMIKLSTDSIPNRCRHQGFCATEDLTLVDCLDLDRIGEVELKDGISNKAKKGSASLESRKKFHPSENKYLTYVGCSNPRPESLKPLLQKIKQPSVLLLRGAEFVLQADFSFKKFITLTVLEISGVTRMSFSLEKTIPLMSQLRSLELSYLPIEKLGVDFSGLIKLSRLILKGWFGLEPFSFGTISELTHLEYLNLSHLLNETLPNDIFRKLVKLEGIILRGCSNLIFLPSIKPLKRLKMLDLSHCSSLRKSVASVFDDIPVQIIDLSYTAMATIPTLKSSRLTHLLMRNTMVAVLASLRQVSCLEVLDLSGAESVKDIKQLAGNTNLRVLNLSRTKIISIDFLHDLIHLRDLILRGCACLTELSGVKNLTKLEVFDVFGCTRLSDLPEGLINLESLKELDLSFTKVSHLPYSYNLPPYSYNLPSLLKLSLRGLRLDTTETLECLSNLVELDLTSLRIYLSDEFTSDFLQYLENLRILNLSDTSVATLPDMSKLVNLKELLLASCQNLKLLPDLQTLTNLETMDLSLPVDYTINDLQQETVSEAQTVQFLSAPSNLRKLVLGNRPGVLKLFPLTSLANLEYLDIRGTGDIDLVRVHSSQMENLQEVVGWDTNTHQEHAQGRSSKADEFHVVSSFYQSGFDRFKTDFKMLEKLISESASSDTLARANIKNQAFKRQFGSMLTDLQYVLKNVNLLESSHDPKSSEELLHELMDAASNPSAYDFHLDPANLNVLLRLILKLKLLIPIKQVDDFEALETTREKKLHFTRRKSKEVDDTDYDRDPQEMEDLESSYRSLNDIGRKCLLCFSIFPCSQGRHENTWFLKSNSLVIQKRMLIHWWVGEGFIDPQHENFFSLSCSSSNENPNQEMCMKTETGTARCDADQVIQQVSTTEMLDKSKTTEEIGKEVLKVLEEEKFIETVINKGRDSGYCCMQPFVHSFVTKRAIEQSFSDFGQEDGKPVSHVTRSERVCLLKSQDNCPSSCQLWANYANSSKKLESSNNIQALLNVNEPIIDIRAEWFTKMKNLLVLHLGGWGFQNSDHIEVVDQKFLEDLKGMKQLRLLSLQGFSAIMKLPDSVCKLTNLRILNVRDCSYLEELPADIGSLKNLIHLDVTNCRFLSMLPKRVRLLSKIQVLKGLAITFQDGGKQHQKACTIRDLSKLVMLKKLSLIVNIGNFPGNEDVQIFREMKNLCNLKITWETSDVVLEESEDSVREASRHSRWQGLKCWESREGQNDAEKTLKTNHLESLKKLVLCCFPSETAPDWLDPSELKNLQKLYIIGGNLATLRGTDQNIWNVNILRMKYLRNLKMPWPVLRDIFRHITYLEIHQCDHLTRFPCNDEGVWTIEREKKVKEDGEEKAMLSQ